jgi:hypothetical protein
MQAGRPYPQGRRTVVAFDDELMVFSDEVTDFLLGRAA